MKKRRIFNRREKVALYLLANGKCEICGTPLYEGWHGDHVQPFSKGGETTITNAQALCPQCNLEKGVKMFRQGTLPEWSLELRDWQQNAILEWQNAKGGDFLAVATPGAGKTLFALRLAHQLLEARIIERIVIVCPTTHLKKQWAEKAYQAGIDINPDWAGSDGHLLRDYYGIAVTYQGVASEIGRLMIEKMCGQHPTFVIFDEIHHAGDEKPWGNSIRQAFIKAKHRLLLSGTPFRSDNRTIPYVNYDQGYSYPAFSYTYSDALRDGVCRPVLFPSFEGDLQWLSKHGEKVSATFADELTEEYASERLRTALSLKGEWLDKVIREADEKLTQIRDEHWNAGGLVIAMDQFHAEGIAKLIFNITGDKPALAISDVPDASQVIERFSKSSSRWIVAVKMVSEGVDIPRLRVLVYATNVSSELYFRQAVGRVIRTVSDLEEQSAYFFMPAVKLLLGYAQTIKEERDHIIEEESKPDREISLDGLTKGQMESLFSVISAQAIPDNVIFDQTVISQEEIARVKTLLRDMGLPYPPEVMVKFMRMAGIQFGDTNQQNQAEPQNTSTKPKYKRIKELRSQVSTLCNKYALMINVEYKEIHKWWLQKGGMPQTQATEEDLMRKRAWILLKIEDYERQ